MATNKTDRAFKTLINKRTTSQDKRAFEEFGDRTINVHDSEVWTEVVPENDPATAVSNGIAELRTLFALTQDTTVGSNQSWYTDDGGRLKDWISDKYGANYAMRLFDNSNNEIFPTDNSDWFFDYQTGILTFTGSTAPHPKPYKITAYRYIGAKGSFVATAGAVTLTVDGVSGSDIPSANRPSKVTSGDYSAYPFQTIQAAIDAVPSFIGHDCTISVTQAGNYTGFSIAGFYGPGRFKVLGLQGLVTPTSGPSSGTATSGTSASLTLTGAGWTVDDFAGKFCEITSGAGAGQHFVIATNTADTLTFAGRMSPAPNGTSVFQITEPKTVVTSNSAAFVAGIFNTTCLGVYEVHDFHIQGPSNGLVQLRSPSSLILERVTQRNGYFGFVSQECLKSEWRQIGSLASTSHAIVYLNTSFAGNAAYEKGWLALNASGGTADGVQVGNCDTFGCQGIYAKNIGNNGVRLVGAKGAFYYVQSDDNKDGIWCQNSFLELWDSAASNNTKRGLGCDSGGRVVVKTALAGSGNGEWGAHAGADGVGGVIELEILPTITGTLGNATVDGSTVLTWAADFASLHDYAHYAPTLAHIARVVV